MPDDTRRQPGEKTRYWISVQEETGEPGGRPAAWNEFPEGAADPPELPADALSRRRFLALLSASAALAAASACSRPDRGEIVPYTERPEEVTPGVPNFYASCFSEGRRAHPVLVKTREGRPIHVEGNDRYAAAPGKAPYRAIADVLGLYDPDRLREPIHRGKAVPVAEAERLLAERAREARSQGLPVLLFTEAVLSPTRARLLAELGKALPRLEVVSYEASEGGGEDRVLRSLFGGTVRLEPLPERAEVVLSLESDFLSGEDPGSVRAFAAGRRPEGPREPMVRFYAAEGRFTLTGSRADARFAVRTGDLAAFALGILRLLVERHGVALPRGLADLPWPAKPLEALLGPGAGEREAEALARDLAAAARRGAALVVAGGHLPAPVHAAAALLNLALGSLGRTLAVWPWPTAFPPVGRREAEGALERAAEGRYGLVLFWGGNPAHAFPGHRAFAQARRETFVRMGLYEDETAQAAALILPEAHWLESWGDFEPRPGLRALRQPALRPLYPAVRQGEQWLLGLLGALGGETAEDYALFLKERWRREEWPPASPVPFERFWAAALHEGLVPGTPPSPPAPSAGALLPHLEAARSVTGLELVLYPSPALLDGRYGNNGWLQEWPDPVTKATWGNPLWMAPADARRLGLKDGDRVRLSKGERRLESPVLVQPGQREGVAALALGYGREALSVARGVGTNGFSLLGGDGEMVLSGIEVEKIPGRQPVPTTQTHHRMEGRNLVRSLSLREWARGEGEGREGHPPVSLYPDQEFPDHKWGMVIDLSACVGCSGCLLACQSENNVPVVGPEQVLRGREMHWIRIDRYYEGPEEAPRAVHSPMLCQHCDNAPCENVCPVNATNHSPDGLNQMAYNRCVGTRYCANNCPYKVRRFNFLEWTAFKREPESLVFNPEVTVRPRGVMEKCTFCVQRIEEAKVRARVEGRKVADGEVVPACAAACPADAIVFGDLKDPESRVSKLARSGRAYKVLEELGVRPSVTYLAQLRNVPEDTE